MESIYRDKRYIREARVPPSNPDKGKADHEPRCAYRSQLGRRSLERTSERGPFIMIFVFRGGVVGRTIYFLDVMVARGPW